MQESDKALENTHDEDEDREANAMGLMHDIE